MRILVVEDEPKTADYLRQGLSESGYVVDVATDGIDGRHLAQEGEYDLVVLMSICRVQMDGACCKASVAEGVRRCSC